MDDPEAAVRDEGVSGEPGTVSPPPEKPPPPMGGVQATRKRPRHPSILAELGLRLCPTGVILPESRKSFLRRRREARELGLCPPAPPPSALALEKGGKKKKLRNKGSALGTFLEDADADLFRSAFSGDIEACEAALADGADVNIRSKADIDGMGTASTALHIAASRGHEEVVAFLLHSQADPNITTGRGEAPILLASRAGAVGVVQLLQEAGGAPADTAGIQKVLDKAPAWDDRSRRQMHAALAPNPDWRNGTNHNDRNRRRRQREPPRHLDRHDETSGRHREESDWRDEQDDCAASEEFAREGSGERYSEEDAMYPDNSMAIALRGESQAHEAGDFRRPRHKGGKGKKGAGKGGKGGRGKGKGKK